MTPANPSAIASTCRWASLSEMARHAAGVPRAGKTDCPAASKSQQVLRLVLVCRSALAADVFESRLMRLPYMHRGGTDT